MSTIAAAVNTVANAEPDSVPKLAGMPLRTAGFKAYVRRLPTAEERETLREETLALPKDKRQGHLLATVSCWGTGEDIPAEREAEYAALLAKASQQELSNLFKMACHLNGTTPAEMLA